MTDSSKQSAGQVVDKICTLANLISAIRLCLIPAFFALLLGGQDFKAGLVFALAAGTDWVDGQVARRTHTVSRLGRILDPAVDRLLMIFGVLGVYMVGRLPLWIIVIVLLRDVMMLAGGALALRRYNVRVDVVYAGKFATTLLYVGFAMLVFNWPIVPGAGVLDVSWLPGLGFHDVSLGIWFVYAGLVVGCCTTAYYMTETVRRCRIAGNDDGREQ